MSLAIDKYFSGTGDKDIRSLDLSNILKSYNPSYAYMNDIYKIIDILEDKKESCEDGSDQENYLLNRII